MNEEPNQRLTLEECKKIIVKQRTMLELLNEQIKCAAIFEKNYINTEEAAILLNVKPRTIRLYNNQGKLQGRKHKKEGRLFFSLKKVLAFRDESLKHWAYFD